MMYLNYHTLVPTLYFYLLFSACPLAGVEIEKEKIFIIFDFINHLYWSFRDHQKSSITNFFLNFSYKISAFRFLMKIMIYES